MAVDTAAKRFSAVHVSAPWRGLGYFPTGTVDAAERQAVAYLYSGISASAPVLVPDVVGNTQAAGTATLQGAGFVVSVTTAYSSVVPAGTIISQNPVGGSFALPGSTVAIVVSLGDAPVQSAAAGRSKRVRTIYRVKVDGHTFEFKSLADAIAFLEQAKATAVELAAQATREATEKQNASAERLPPPSFELPDIEISSRELRGAVTETKREIKEIYRKAVADIEVAMLATLRARETLEKDNEDTLWLLM